MSVVDISGHRLAARVSLGRYTPSASVACFLSDIGDPGGPEWPALDVRVVGGTCAPESPMPEVDVTWNEDVAGITDVTWRGAGWISGRDGSGTVDVTVCGEGTATDWMIRTAIGSAACATGRVVGVHGCVVRAPDGRTVLLLGPGGSGKTSLSLWLVAWRGYQLLVEDFVYLRHDWTVVTAPVRDFLTLRRWTWELLSEAPGVDKRPLQNFPDHVAQVRAPLSGWVHRPDGRVRIDVVVRLRRASTRESTVVPNIDVGRALVETRELTMTDWLVRFANRRAAVPSLPNPTLGAAALWLGADWPHDPKWWEAFEEVSRVHAA